MQLCLTTVFRGRAEAITSGMAMARCLPHADALSNADRFSATVAEDTLALAGQLADALHILTQCHARNVPLSEEFLAYVDDLTEQIQLLQPSRAISSA